MSRSLVLALTAVALVTSVTQAQLPGLRRKLKDAGRQAVSGQPQQRGAPPKFDNTILELNPQVVARLIAGLEARSRTAGTGGQTAGDLRRRAAAASDEAATINNQHSDDRERWVNANGEAENCVSEQLNNVEQQHAQQMQQRFAGMTGVNTPEKTKFMQDYTAAAQEAQQAAATNDTAGLRRAQVKLNRLMGIDAHADTVKARATCHVPPVPAWMRRADSLAALGDTLAVRARGVEGAGNTAAARAAEMTPEQFAMAAERAEAFVVLHRPGNVGGGYVFSDTEDQALTARLPDLKKYFG
ncbi:MAG TPA: hypothetical protein VL549_02750 [Gemmatimonadales bacterium]|jgi:hypothetical protein|nr:hypothetical protein [Gemmatimonadales bacterium]